MAELKIGTKIDRLFKLREKRKVVKKELEDIKAKEKELSDDIMKSLPKDKIEGAAGKLAKCSISKKKVPAVKDWPKFWKYILRNKATDMLQKRVSQAAWEERVEKGKKVPGVESFTVVSLSLTKKKAK